MRIVRFVLILAACLACSLFACSRNKQGSNDVVVTSGKTTSLPPIDLAVPKGAAVLSGRISPKVAGAEIKLMSEGRERAAVHADPEGNYEFKELPAGAYTMRTNAPGHAGDTTEVVIAGSGRVEQNAVLLPIANVEGVDWTAGKIRARGIGMPPHEAANESVRREMTRRAALADAERNMLRTIEQIRIDRDRDVKTAMRNAAVASRIQGFLKGYSVASERELDNGGIEVVLELPLTGPNGLSRYLRERP